MSYYTSASSPCGANNYLRGRYLNRSAKGPFFGKVVLLLLIAISLPIAALGQNLGDEFISAAKKGDLAAMKSLLAKGADVNSKSNYGATALSFACDRGNVEVVKFLLENGADLNVKDTFYGATPLSWAQQNEHPEIVKLLLQKGVSGKEGILTAAASQGNADMVKVVLGVGGLKPEALGQALKRADAAKHPEIVELLKKAGAVMPPKPNVQIDADTLQSYAGNYKSEDFDVTVLLADGKLKAKTFGQEFSFDPVDKTTFSAVEQDGLTFVFQTENGKVTGLTLKAGERKFPLKRVESK